MGGCIQLAEGEQAWAVGPGARLGNAPAIRVTGIGLGETEVVINTDAGQLRLPVVVQ